MKVKELIARLEKYNDEDDEIIVAYWAKGDVNGWYQAIDITDKQWKKLVDKLDYHDFQNTSEIIISHELENIMEETNEQL